ncbi:hypothetical protein D1610_11850 [Sphingomonas gilva]|uniref:CBM-cenC domain-containing protein n=1 Tax=Sphingomonas gilva TaxID=2305907 RepID=A0A396RU61_9SPHN|nr:hypothetical protein [Sphingomonas gilva]RHW17231.1 hypothetical protein D1610_11850 [Sphingomonas gilva]
MIRSAILVLAMLASAPVALSAQSETMLNTPSVESWNVYGAGQTHKLRKDDNVQGGGAMRIDVAKAQANVWDVGASTPISGAIAKGDRLVVAFWARLESGGTGGSAEIPTILQVASPPYAPIVAGSVTLGGEWKLVSITGTAAADHAAGSTNVALQLGGAAQKIDLGPAFVMKLAK